jgi:histidinol dehydrogenase
VIAVSRVAAVKLGRVAVTLAEGEGLSAHARAAKMRFE